MRFDNEFSPFSNNLDNSIRFIKTTKIATMDRLMKIYFEDKLNK
tara:strand:- start:217 stop:348 length:132 start_codon:yes stop_codon:yes gene_type:complete